MKLYSFSLTPKTLKFVLLGLFSSILCLYIAPVKAERSEPSISQLKQELQQLKKTMADLALSQDDILRNVRSENENIANIVRSENDSFLSKISIENDFSIFHIGTIVALCGVLAPLVINSEASKKLNTSIRESSKDLMKIKEDYKLQLHRIKQDFRKEMERKQHEYDQRAVAMEQTLNDLVEDSRKSAQETRINKQKAIIFITEEEYQNRLTRINNLLEESPEDEELWLMRAYCHAKLNQQHNVIEDCKRVRSINIGNMMVYKYLANAMSELGDYNGAIINYSIALELEPKNASFYNNRAAAKYHLEDYNGAVEDCKQAIQLSQGNGLPYLHLGNAYRGMMRYEKALESFTKGIKMLPNLAKLYNARAATYREMAQAFQFKQKDTEYIKLAEADEERAILLESR